MRIYILATQWGAESMPFEDFLIKIKTAGYDGVDTWVPDDAAKRREFIKLLVNYEMAIVCHQHQARGNSIEAFCQSFEYYLNLSMESAPLLINSHSGRDYFNLDDQLKVIDTAQQFAAKHNITIAHETHRGHIGYSPYNSKELFALRPEMRITADFSHWVCVTESYLEHSRDILNNAIARTEHIHARVGFTEGPQVPDPRVAACQQETAVFMQWWQQIAVQKRTQGRAFFTITPEFGPPPYMPVNPTTGLPVADQFAINNYMKDELRKHLG